MKKKKSELTELIARSMLKPKLYALYNYWIKLLVKYHLWRSSKFRIAPKGYTEKEADDIWWKHNSKTENLIEKLKRI